MITLKTRPTGGSSAMVARPWLGSEQNWRKDNQMEEAEVITEPEPRAAVEVKELKLHPAAEIFPQLTDEELDELAKDIEAHGLRQPIWVLDGKILDGRNRWNACRMVGVEIPDHMRKEYTGDDPVAFVISQNLRRRHLTPSQLGMVAIEIEKVYAEKTKEKEQQRKSGGDFPKNGKVKMQASRQAAAAVGVSHGSVEQAKAIAKASPELAKEVKEGKKSISAAQCELRSKETSKEQSVFEQLRKFKTKTLQLKNSVDAIEEILRSNVLKDKADTSLVRTFIERWKQIHDMYEEFTGSGLR
jgi:hypothetical protein